MSQDMDMNDRVSLTGDWDSNGECRDDWHQNQTTGTRATGPTGCTGFQNEHSQYPQRNAITCYRCREQGHIHTGCLVPEVPRFADISRVLTHLTKKDMEFKWTAECKNCFQILIRTLQESPILRYPDPEANYTLYTDASKYAYAGVLIQDIDGTDHPITYVSGLFRDSQLKWATLTKEAYAIYISIKKLSFYIDTAKITVKSDHLPLKKFLEKNTMNA